MELRDLMEKVSSFNIPHYLIFFGEEQKIIDEYIHQIRNFIKHTYIPCESVQSVSNITRRKTLDKRCRIFTVIDDFTFSKNADAWGIVKKQFNNSKDYLILRYNTLSKKESFYKKNKQNCVQFSHLSDEVLQQYIQCDLPDLSDENISKLIGYCSNDYGRILFEIDKVKQYTKFIKSKNEDKCFEELDKQGLFHKEIGDITFELTDAVLGGYPEKAIQKLDEAKRKGEPVMMIASILYNGFRNLLAYQGLGSNKQGAMERTGLTKGELWGCTKNVGGYNIEEVKRNMLLCQEIESGIKMGKIDEDISLDYLILKCLS